MLSKCANPSCSAAFLYLHEGKIFYLAAKPTAEDRSIKKPTRKHERFWLCDACSRKMTIVSRGSEAVVVPREELSAIQKQPRRRNAVAGQIGPSLA
jgi:hypothetical protein